MQFPKMEIFLDPEKSIAGPSIYCAMKDYNNPQLFEIAWEVANRVGGIYTVLKTKVPVTVEEYGSRYCLIGPLSKKNASLEVEICDPEDTTISDCLNEMRSAGVNVIFGKWLIDGSPSVILFDLESMTHRLNEWKGDIWSVAGIPCPSNDQEMNDSIIFGYLNAWFMGLFCAKNCDKAVIAHYHEWLASAGLVLLKKRNLAIATIFTTHATLLGRYLCAGNVDFYNSIRSIDIDAEAGRRGIYHRYCLERAATHCADVFTTVSHITAYEAEYLLCRKADGVLPNGLNVVKFSAMHEFQNLHAASKKKINSFVQGHFYGHLDFDLDNTLYMFISGRYEYRNKGVDMYLEGLARLNARLKQYNSPVTVVAFIIMPAQTQNYNIDSLKGQAVTKQLRDVVGEISKHIEERIFESALRGNIIEDSSLLSDEDVVQLKRHILAIKRTTLPPVVTHNMVDGYNDPILSELRRLNLHNSPSDRVKIVFHPEFLNSNNPVLGMDYEDFVRGCHLGLFPSYYEPWGYTPAECTLMGIPSITTNLSGFGSFIEDTVESPSDYGIYIVDRRMKSVEESCNQLADFMFQFCQKTRRQRINQRNRTERLSDILDWRRMGIEYQKARFCALEILAKRLNENSRLNSESRRHSSTLKIENDKVPRPLSAPPSPRMKNIKDSSVRDETANLQIEKLKIHEQVEIDDQSSSIKLENVI